MAAGRGCGRACSPEEPLDDADLLELALFAAVPRRDTRPIVDRPARPVRRPHRRDPGACRCSARHLEGLGDAGIAALWILDRVSQCLDVPLAYRPLLNNQDRLA